MCEGNTTSPHSSLLPSFSLSSLPHLLCLLTYLFTLWLAPSLCLWLVYSFAHSFVCGRAVLETSHHGRAPSLAITSQAISHAMQCGVLLSSRPLSVSSPLLFLSSLQLSSPLLLLSFSSTLHLLLLPLLYSALLSSPDICIQYSKLSPAIVCK